MTHNRLKELDPKKIFEMSNSSNLVSVVIPCFNRESTLARSIHSVLNQTHRPHEVIVVDDGSTDRSVEIAKQFSDTVRVFSQPNGGAASARNQGIRLAIGDWIAFLDSDDQWHPEKLELQLSCANRFPEAKLIFCDTQTLQGQSVLMDTRVGKGGVRGFETKSDGDFKYFDRLFPQMLRQSRVITSAVIVRRGLKDLSFPEHIWGSEDWALWLKLGCRYPFALVDRLLVTMHQQGDNISSRKGKLYRNDLNVLNDLLSDTAVEPEERDSIVCEIRAKTLGALYYSLIDGDGKESRELLKQLDSTHLSKFKSIQYWIASFTPPKVLRMIRNLKGV